MIRVHATRSIRDPKKKVWMIKENGKRATGINYHNKKDAIRVARLLRERRKKK